MRIEVTIAKTSPLPAGAIDALAGELSRRIQYAFPDNEGHVSVRYAAANNLSVIGATKEDKQRISEIPRKRGKAPMTGLSANNMQ